MLGLTNVQLFNLAIAVLLLIVVVWRIRKNHFVRIIDYPRLYWSATLAIHAVIFYIATGLEMKGIMDFNLTAWSSLLRLHMLLTFLYIEIVEVYYGRRKSHG